MSARLKKFKGTSDNQAVDFAAANFLMILENQDGLLSLSCIVTDGTNTATKRIANGLSNDADVEKAFGDWLKATTIDGNDDAETAELKGRVYANHNVVGLGRPIIIKGQGVSLRDDLKGNPFVVSRYAEYFPSEEIMDTIIGDLKKSNATIRENITLLLADKEFFKGDSESDKEMIAEINREYSENRGATQLNNMKISCLQNPHIAGMSKDYLSKDEARVKLAFANTGLNFDKYYPNGFDVEAEPATTAGSESDTNAKTATGKAKTQPEIVEDPAKQLQEEIVNG